MLTLHEHLSAHTCQTHRWNVHLVSITPVIAVMVKLILVEANMVLQVLYICLMSEAVPGAPRRSSPLREKSREEAPKITLSFW